MKTEDLLTNLSGQTFSDHTSMIEWLENQCKQLELDAFKAGMERARQCKNAEASKYADDEHQRMWNGGYNQSTEDFGDAILTTSQQLTEVPR